MSIANVFKTTTAVRSPLDASSGTTEKATVSDFLTVQTFTNFAAMTGAITAAWHGAQTLTPRAATVWVPYLCAFAWGVISVLISVQGLKKSDDSQQPKLEIGTVFQAIFVAVVNSLVLGGAVVGTNVVTSQTP